MSELRCREISPVPKFTPFVVAGDYCSGLPTPKPMLALPYFAASKLEKAKPFFFFYKMKHPTETNVYSLQFMVHLEFMMKSWKVLSCCLWASSTEVYPVRNKQPCSNTSSIQFSHQKNYTLVYHENHCLI